MNIHRCTGPALKLARHRLGLTPEILAWKLNCREGIEMTTNQIQEIEEGKIMITEEPYKAWCKILGKRPYVIYAEAEGIAKREQDRKKPKPPLM